jgi:hypothetical protein
MMGKFEFGGRLSVLVVLECYFELDLGWKRTR